MNIPEAAVEAAVEAHCEGTMRAALEAAAPFIAVQALCDAADWLEDEGYVLVPDKLRNRASGV